MDQKISTVTIDIPYKSSGGVIRQNPVSFEVFRIDGHYSLRPCLDPGELQVANLPGELNFEIRDEKPVSLRGLRDGNFHVIQDAYAVLREQNLL